MLSNAFGSKELNNDLQQSKDLDESNYIGQFYVYMYTHIYIYTHTQAYKFSIEEKHCNCLPSQCSSTLFHTMAFQRKLHLKDTQVNLRLLQGGHQCPKTRAQCISPGGLGSKGLAKHCKISLTHTLFSSDLYFILTYAYSCENTTPQHF